MPPRVRAKLEGLKGQRLSRAALEAELEARLSRFELELVRSRGDRLWADPEHLDAGLRGYSAEGYLGQLLYVLPRAKLVVVRMVDATEDEARVDFPSFFHDVEALADASGTRVLGGAR